MGIKILVVDDMLERRKWLKRLLERKGYKVTVATDGQAALSRLKMKNEHYDLVLTDTKMPCLTGPELVEEMKQRKIKVLVIGMSNREESRELYQNFWRKDESYEKLFCLIRQLTEKSPK